jgi:hypothetical protein
MGRPMRVALGEMVKNINGVRDPLLDSLPGRAPAHCWGLAMCGG